MQWKPRMRRKIKPTKTATLVAVATIAFCASVSSSSPGFPGTIQPPPYPSQKSKEDSKSSSNKGSSSSDDEAGEAGESSSDWDDALIMEEDPMAFVVDNVENLHSHSSDGDVDNDSENDGERVLSKESEGTPESLEIATNPLAAPPPPPPLKNADPTPVQTSSSGEELVSLAQDLKQQKKKAEVQQSSNSQIPKPPPPNGHRNSKDPYRRPSNKKPLQTLEKLQQLLDNTDYLTTTDDLSQQQHSQEQQRTQSSSTKTTVGGINSLWTSKDRTKYKKQQRLQKEQIRLKQQQEEQLRKQQQPMSDTEELSDTDNDFLGYTLPNLPVYLSDGEEETDETTFLSEQSSSTWPPEPSSSSRSQKKQKQKQERQLLSQQQYLQQQRELFLAQSQQQTPPPRNSAPYQNQQPPPPQQLPYYGTGAYPPPPPPPMGYYPYGPPPPQYYQYHPSYYPYRGLPRIDTTVPRNPKQIPPASAAGIKNGNVQEPSQEENGETGAQDSTSKSVEGEGGEGESSAYPQTPFDPSYYPQSPDEQELWHWQQLQMLQAQEKYQRALHRKHQRMLFIANVRSWVVSTWNTIGSARKISTCMALVAATCYGAVSPRNLPYLEYNRRFYQNLQNVALVVLPPLVVYGWLLIDWGQLRQQLGGSSPLQLLPQAEGSTSSTNPNKGGSALEENSDLSSQRNKTRKGSISAAIHTLVHSFYSSFVYGYLWVFALEIAWTTVLRLGIFLAWEPDMFGVQLPWSSTPKSAFEGITSEAVPNFLILPWALREYKYKPKRITLLAADILTSCIACPIVEEFAKLRLLQWTMPLARNYVWIKKPSKPYKKNKMKKVAEPITPETDETGTQSLDGNVTNITPYIAGMLAVSLGLKWADAIRRVCMYTKIHDENKSIYAFLRGAFPVQELCGIMTALGLARRDILGQKMPLWKLLLPATIVHSMANLRGMKPIFKWNSSTPWAEMQLSPDLFPDLFSPSALLAMEEAGVSVPLPPTTKLQWLGRALPKITWVIILGRAAGYCAKNYFMINRQAVRRATTYAGKHAAFSAELETTQMLKNIKKDQYNEK